MSAETLVVEQLDSGLKAAFVHMPHFRTHSARLTINAGSAHETPDAYGAAHFLEHITFQGTEAMPEEEDVHRYAEVNGLTQNAFTARTRTTYVADGYDLESVGFYVSQLAFRPSLTAEALEGERKPIIDEIRGYTSSPNFLPSMEHNRATRGDIYARSVSGSAQDVEQMTPEALRAYHQRHYRLGNATLVICSAEPIDAQRDFATSLMSEHSDSGQDAPKHVEFGPFNPSGLLASLQLVELPLSAQSNVSISYEVPATTSTHDLLSYNLVGIILSRVAHNRLRRELALCYDAGAGVNRLSDLNFGRNKNWAHFSANASLSGADGTFGLDTLYDKVLHQPLPVDIFESTLVTLRRNTDHILQSNPAQVADSVSGIMATSNRESVALDEVVDFAATVSLDDLRELHKNILDTKPLVMATSPDPEVLSDIGNWAASKS